MVPGVNKEEALVHLRGQSSEAAAKRRILLVDDDPSYGPIVCQRLRREGFIAEWAATGHAGLFKVRFCRPNLVLLDIHIPDLDGIVLHKALRQAPQTRMIPIILLTALDVMDSLLQAAVAGIKAEPVFRKLDSLDVLVERVRQALRSRVEIKRTGGASSSDAGASSPEVPAKVGPPSSVAPRYYDWCGLRFYPDLRRIVIDGKAVKFNNKEAMLVEIFIRNPGIVQGSQQLREAVWPSSIATGWRHALDSRISSLRKKLGEKWGRCLVCLKNEGYVLLPRPCQD